MIDELDIDVPLWIEGGTSLRFVSLAIYHFFFPGKLARITTHILRKNYNHNSCSFIQNCNTVLNQLRNWLDDLSSELELKYKDFDTDKSRPTVNLHINYNYSY